MLRHDFLSHWFLSISLIVLALISGCSKRDTSQTPAEKSAHQLPRLDRSDRKSQSQPSSRSKPILVKETEYSSIYRFPGRPEKDVFEKYKIPTKIDMKNMSFVIPADWTWARYLNNNPGYVAVLQSDLFYSLTVSNFFSKSAYDDVESSVENSIRSLERYYGEEGIESQKQIGKHLVAMYEGDGVGKFTKDAWKLYIVRFNKNYQARIKLVANKEKMVDAAKEAEQLIETLVLTNDRYQPNKNR